MALASHDLKIAIEEDSISSLGVAYSTQIPETITSITVLLKTETADKRVSAAIDTQSQYTPTITKL